MGKLEVRRLEAARFAFHACRAALKSRGLADNPRRGTRLVSATAEFSFSRHFSFIPLPLPSPRYIVTLPIVSSFFFRTLAPSLRELQHERASEREKERGRERGRAGSPANCPLSISLPRGSIVKRLSSPRPGIRSIARCISLPSPLPPPPRHRNLARFSERCEGNSGLRAPRRRCRRSRHESAPELA